MKFVIQRVSEASVEVEGAIVGEIQTGYLVLIGAGQGDTKAEADKLIRKLFGLRIFPDENDKTNLSLKDVNGSLLLISQFTLYANCVKGNRPSFTEACDPALAKELYDYVVEECKKQAGTTVQTGVFGAHMKVRLCNEGPFTIVLESEKLHPVRPSAG